MTKLSSARYSGIGLRLSETICTDQFSGVSLWSHFRTAIRAIHRCIRRVQLWLWRQQHGLTEFHTHQTGLATLVVNRMRLPSTAPEVQCPTWLLSDFLQSRLAPPSKIPGTDCDHWQVWFQAMSTDHLCSSCPSCACNTTTLKDSCQSCTATA